MGESFGVASWKSRVVEWWQNAARDLPGTAARLGVQTAYGLLTASAWLPLLEAYARDPGSAVTALVGVVSGVGSNLVANLVQGAYEKATAPRQAEQEVIEGEELRGEHRQIVEALGALTAAQEALGERWEGFYDQLCREDRELGGELHIESGGGAVVTGSVDTGGGDFVGRDQTVHGDRVEHKVEGDQYQFEVNVEGNLVPEAAAGILRALRRPPEEKDLRQAMEEYLHCVLDRHSYLRLKGMGVSDRVPLRLPLLDLYVPLKARVQLPEGETWKRGALLLAGREVEAGHMPLGRLSEPRPVLDLLRENDGLIVLGDPGAGKTTFLRFLALKLALGQGEELGLNRRFPVLVPLSAYANALAEEDERLDEFIVRYLHDMGADLPIGDLLREALAEGRALVLLDGLDEVRQARLRHLVVERVVDFYTFHRRAGSKFVLTSRIVGYREVRPTVEGMAECTLVDFEEDEIAAFVERWTAALEQAAGGATAVAAQDAERERAELLEAIRRNPGVRRLAANPLLLTILALMKRQGVTLPERRVELYDQYVRTLLSSWNRARGLGRPPARDLDVVQTERVLAPLALWMHEVSPGVGLVKRGELERRLVQVYADRGDKDPEGAARRLLSDVREHAGLLLERGAGQYGFIHLTFEEYLAAMGVARLGQREIEPVVDVLAAHVGDAEWREVSLLAVGYLGIVQQWERMASDVVGALIARAPGEPGEAAVLAGEAVLDAWPGGVTEGCKEKVQKVLVGTMQDAEVTPRLRRQAGWVLGRLGWQPEDLDAMVEIAPGPFLYGERGERQQISRRYWIGRYPVTNAQYARFVEGGGYEERAYWSEEGWAWRTGTYDSKVPDYLKDHMARRPAGRRDRPFWWGEVKWNNPIFPVVGVCWFEAQAYCSWVEEQLRVAGCGLRVWRDGRLEEWRSSSCELEQVQVRLPTEEEWERAARGTDGRRYPWGEELDLGRLNCADAWAGREFERTEDWREWLGNLPDFAGTTAVCTYPRGATEEGVYDGAGNVWEWTSSWYDEERNARVLRGGSWNLTSRDARCSARLGDNPVGWNDLTGFRVVFSLALSEF